MTTKVSRMAACAALAMIGLASPAVAQQANQPPAGHDGMPMGGMMGQGMMPGGMMGPGMMQGGTPGSGMRGCGMMGHMMDPGTGGGMTQPGMMRMMDSGMMGMSGPAYRAFDADGDGTVTNEEARAGLLSDLERFDGNGDGALSLEEFAALHAEHTRTQMVRAFQFRDDDGDSRVTAEEMGRMVP